LVDLVAAVDGLDRPHRHARALHVDQEERNTLLLLALRVGAREEEDPVGVLRHGGPGLLAGNHPRVAIAARSSPQAGEIRPRAGLREALAPPVSKIENAWQKPFLLRPRTERVDDRPDHVDPEGDRLGRVAALDLVEENRLLDRAPPGSAPFNRPVRRRPALVRENARPANVVLLGEPPTRDSFFP